MVERSVSGKSVETKKKKKKGWKKIHFGNITYKLMKEAGIERTQDGKSEKEFREKLRQEHGPECYAKFLEKDIKEALKKSDVVLDGLYSWHEYKYLIEKFPNLKLICIVVDKKLRYKRVENRPDRPFIEKDIIYRDTAEIENLAKGGPIAYADYYLFNNGSLEEYHQRLLEILEEINKPKGEK